MERENAMLKTQMWKEFYTFRGHLEHMKSKIAQQQLEIFFERQAFDERLRKLQERADTIENSTPKTCISYNPLAEEGELLKRRNSKFFLINH